jgi:quercetin dioxygenase-like cupin family protein
MPPLRLLLASAVLLAALPALGADPLETDPGKYTLVMENARVRVLRYRDNPGERTARHRHPDLVLHALGPFKRRLTLEDGKTREVELAAGDVMFLHGQEHVGENIGSTPTEALLVELKEPRPAAAPKKPSRPALPEGR